VGVQRHRNEHDQVAEENREDSLPPVHALLDQAASQGIGGDANRHPDPERGDAPHRPGAGHERDRREIVVDKGVGSDRRDL
jgi:hypothetical protein